MIRGPLMMHPFIFKVPPALQKYGLSEYLEAGFVLIPCSFSSWNKDFLIPYWKTKVVPFPKIVMFLT